MSTNLNDVHGIIYDKFNQPIPGVTVSVFDKDLRKEQLLAQTVTNSDGSYKINYDFSKYAAAERKSADVFVRVLNPAGAMMGQSDVTFNVPSEFALNFKIDNTPFRGISEFDDLVNNINPLLQDQEVRIAGLQENDKFKDISFLSSEIEASFDKLTFMPTAFSLAEQTKIPADIYYGLFRMSFPTDLNALFHVSIDSLLNGLKAAIAANIISSKWDDNLDKILRDLNTLATNYYLTTNDEQDTKFKKIISQALPSADLQLTFVNTYFNTEATPDTFWTVLATQPGFTDGKAINEMKALLSINHLTGYEPSLTSLLYNESRNDADLKEARGFSKFTNKDWVDRITKLVATGQLTNFPDGVEGSTLEEKTANYAGIISNIIQAIYPTSVFFNRLKNDTANPFGDTGTDLITFLKNNPDFDLATNKLDSLFDQSKLDGVKNKEAAKGELKKINRLYKLSSNYDDVRALRNLALGSATDIVQQYTVDELIQKLAPASISKEEATVIYQKSVELDKKSTALVLAYKMRNDVPIYAITGDESIPADYQSMFKDNSLCDCEQCQSVYSPSAYFVDILNFLRQNSGGVAFAKLIDRRSDLDDILLTCNNTNIPLPYIDLVNELLESVVADQTTVAYQTESTAQELAAFPQNVLATAYDKLKVSSAHYQLPLDLPLETSRRLLEKLELKRQGIMELFFPAGNSTFYADVEIAKEALGLSDGDVGILNGSIAITGISGGAAMTTVLQESQLSYMDLLQVLESYFVNPLKNDGTRTLQIVSTDADDPTTCDIEKLSLSGIDQTGLKKLVRFVRLQKKLGWNVFDVDRLLNAFNINSFDLTPTDFNTKVVLKVSDAERFKRRYNIPVERMLGIFSSIGTKIYVDHALDEQPAIPSLYDELFRNKAVSNPIDPAFKPQGVALTGTITDHLPVILSALNISPEDFNLLMEGNGGSIVAIADLLTLENLSELYRRAFFARLTKLTIQEFFDVVTIVGINPLQDNDHLEQTFLFLDELDFIRKGTIKLNELNYLLLDVVNDPNLIPSIETVAGKLDPVRAALKKFSTEIVSDDLISDPNIRSSAESIVIDKLSSALRADHATSRVMLNETVKFAGDPTKSYLEAFLLPTFFNSTAPLFTLDDSKNAVPSLPDYFTSYYHAYKISFLVKKLKLSADELAFFTANAVGLSIDALFNNTVPIPYNSFVALSTLIRVRNIWKLPSDHLMEVLNIALQNEPNGKNNFIVALSNATESDQATLAFLLGDPTDISKKGILNFEFPAHYSNGKKLLQLMACIAVSQKAGVDLAAFISAVQTNDGTFLTGLLKSKYADDKWIETIEPISDQLRTVKRDALVAYVLNDPTMQTFRVNSHISDVNSLYEYLLIDTEMDSCMLTSRIKQGISSVQLFIDRCLMKLEDGVLLDQDFVTQWNAWRKQYRVWEANRKIFLYPENWIEPELRDDKSPFFQELESKLRQNEVTEDIADDVLYAYLEKLDTVANLEIIGVFDDELTNIVHVFGRTKAVPHQYFYRYQETGVWTAWEKVGVDPEGDYVLPVVWNNRLMLMWAVFQEKQEDTSGITINPGQSTPQPDKFFEVKLAWTEYKNGKWGTKKVSKEVIKTPVTTVIKLYQIESRIVDGKLIVNLFFWLPLNNTDGFFDNLGSGAFIFDGCNSSPSVHTIGFHDSLNQTLLTAPDLSSSLMFLTENAASDQKFQLFDTGVFRLSSSKGLRDIFLSSPAKATVLSNHHEIERERREKFFFSNRVNNFFVQSSAPFRKDFFDNVLVNSTGVLVARKEIVPQDKTFTPGVALTTLKSNGSAFTSNGNGSVLNLKTIANPFIIFFGKRYLFQSFYHPYVCSLIKTFNTQGVDGLYVEDIQNRVDAPIFSPANYNPTAMVSTPYPLEKFEFDFAGIYSIYNWELFFHIPLLIASRLSQNQKFEDARKWFHYIFDPTKSATDPNEGPERFWIPKPFKDEIRKGILSIQDILDETKNPDLQTQLNYWAANPFNPHAVARLRISAYMRSTVMKYIDNLIAWGDNLFQRDTIESINEATLLYILAANILGKKPEKVPARAIPTENSFSTIEDMLDFFSNAKVEVQSFISPSSDGDSTTDHAVMMPMFGIPKNDELLAYWDVVGDRLYKIRHCMNIEGVVRQLALFEPPLDPGLLAKATALGLDLNSIMNDAIVSLPHYRFRYMLQKAYELCNDVKMLGSELQSALEKGDAEQLSLLRSTQEVTLLQAMRDVKSAQLDEANEALNSLNGAKAVAENRRDYYASRTFKNASEDTYFSSSSKATIIQEGLTVENILSGILYAIPDLKIGSAFSIGATFGGSNLGRASGAAISSAQSIIAFLRMEAELANTKGTYDRRQDDWTFQANNADLDVKQFDRQIAAAQIRVAIAQTELDNHDLQTENSSEVNDFMQSKFTNAELYDFMVEQISSVYFQAYQVAFQVAKKAEKCFQQEIGVEDSTYIQFGYWDSLRKGLLSGHKLQADLRRLESAYVDQNRREFEITKHVSLAIVNASSILDIRKNGVCTFQLPELLFEMDFPGHYFRRIKSIGLTIPCIAGPYTAVSSQLTMNKSYVRTKDENGDEIFDFANPSSTFKLASTVVKATATSNGQADTGMFELNFNDERYFPFEGAGVISEWNIELPSEARQFDYNSISDIIISIKYTSRDSNDPSFKQAVNTKIKEAIKDAVDSLNNKGGLFKLISMKNDFPDLFYQMKADSSTSPTTKEIQINKSFFPFFTNKYDVLFKSCSFFNKDGTAVTFPIQAGNSDSEVIDDNWKLILNYNPVDIKTADDIYLLIAYSLSS